MLLPVVIFCFTIQILTAGVPAKSSGEEAVRRDKAERNLIIKKPFTSVRVEGNYRLIYTVGPAYRVRLSGREELVENTLVTVQNDNLTISLTHDEVMRQLRSRKDWSVKVYVTAPAFSRIDVINGGNVTMDTGMSVGGKLYVAAIAGATFNADKGLTCDTLIVTGADGSIVNIKKIKSKKVLVVSDTGARVTMSGAADFVGANVSSGANADLSGLEARKVNVKATMGATVTTCKGDVDIHRSSGAVVNKK